MYTDTDVTLIDLFEKLYVLSKYNNKEIANICYNFLKRFNIEGSYSVFQHDEYLPSSDSQRFLKDIQNVRVMAIRLSRSFKTDTSITLSDDERIAKYYKDIMYNDILFLNSSLRNIACKVAHNINAVKSSINSAK